MSPCLIAGHSRLGDGYLKQFMIKTISISLGLMFLISVGYSQTTEKKLDSLVVIGFKCINDTLIINIPSGQYKTQRSWYEEGFIYSITYSDNSVITILCGYSADLVLNNKNKDRFARRTTTKGRTIIYENVKADRVDIFNKAFDLMEKK